MPGLVQFTGAVLFAAILWLWLLVINRWRRGKALVAFEPRRPAPWTGWDLVFIALGTFVLNVVVARYLTGGQNAGASGEAVATDPARMPALLMAGAMVNLSMLLAGVVWIRHRRGADWTDLGLDLSRLPADLFLGLAAFAVVSVPIYAMQAGLTYFFPAEHPIIKALRSAEPGWGLWFSSLVSAVLVAPLAEEFSFRVLLQGWLESLGRQAEPEGQVRGRWMPVVISAAVFALMHLPRPDVVPLFFLALALGYLYRQTHRLWPSMVAHGCLNACSLGMLWLSGPARL
jgi:membrane protease YdiL (CAAX protease family)